MNERGARGVVMYRDGRPCRHACVVGWGVPSSRCAGEGNVRGACAVRTLALDRVDPIGDGPVHAILEALGTRQLAMDADLTRLERADERLLCGPADIYLIDEVARVVAGVVMREGRDGRRLGVVRATPFLELLLTVDCARLLL